jgi:ankyrin repeat protein
MLIEKGADVNAKSTKDVTPLMVAAANDNPPLIGVLAQAGADLGAKSSNGRTALEIAQLNGNAAALQQLKLLAPPKRAAPTKQPGVGQ